MFSSRIIFQNKFKHLQFVIWKSKNIMNLHHYEPPSVFLLTVRKEENVKNISVIRGVQMCVALGLTHKIYLKT